MLPSRTEEKEGHLRAGLLYLLMDNFYVIWIKAILNILICNGKCCFKYCYNCYQHYYLKILLYQYKIKVI